MDSLNPFFYPPESFLEDLESQSRASDLLGLMEGRRIRRFGRGSQSSRTLLPLRLTRLTNAVSCWYCDFKTSVLNEPLYRYGRRHSRCLRVWFSVGLGFSLTALLGVILVSHCARNFVTMELVRGSHEKRKKDCYRKDDMKWCFLVLYQIL
ncbi:uncharacterized protein [Coffea arabica]|uniref:Uncharacterized protein n=1 Tax=Coffea arabica TaxID=13443 RepID=A0ABM4VNT8_COFAR